MVELRSVSKHFGGAEIVSGVSLKVERGQIVGLIGPNGAGKTTLFNLIAGALRPSRGAIYLNDAQITGEGAHRRLARGLGRTFQIPRPFAAMTVIENMLTAAQAQSGERLFANWLKPRQVADEEGANARKALACLEFLGLAHLAKEPARILSGGQRKLLELGRVLMADPTIILLDEPGAGVNPVLLDTIIDRVKEINRRGVTFLIIEHNMDLIARLCGHVFVLSAGRLLCEGTPSSVVSDPQVIEAYLGTGAA